MLAGSAEIFTGAVLIGVKGSDPFVDFFLNSGFTTFILAWKGHKSAVVYGAATGAAISQGRRILENKEIL